jgi:hypothetical protein
MFMKVGYCCLTLTSTEKGTQIVAKLSKIKCHKNLFNCLQVVKCVETQRWTDRVIKTGILLGKNTP